MQNFEPDQLVLVRENDAARWRLTHYSHTVEGMDWNVTIDGKVWASPFIISYAGNEHLLGTTDSPTPKWEPKPGESAFCKLYYNDCYEKQTKLRRRAVKAEHARDELADCCEGLFELVETLSVWPANAYIAPGFLPEIETCGMNPLHGGEMMLDEKTLEWLERRKNLCTRCYKKNWCRAGAKHNFNTTKCRYFEMQALRSIIGYVSEDYHDAAEFEARVAKKLCDPFWNYAVAERYFELALPYRRLPAAVLLKAARLEVEADMIREGKGPGSPEEE